tara:strand:- start:304 stop:483 length:180 start_codon:yes stop_codon:yes gene_type:complete
MVDFNRSLEFHQRQNEKKIIERLFNRELEKKIERNKNKIKFQGKKNYANAIRKPKGNLG